MNNQRDRDVGDIMFVGTVGEEELGNLRGVKALFRDNKDIDGFISIAGSASPESSTRRPAAIATSSSSRAPAAILPGVWPAERDPRHGPRDRQDLGVADTGRSADHLHRRHRDRRHLVICDCRRSQ